MLERALDKVLLPELGDLKTVDVGPDRIATLIRDLEDSGCSPATIRRYLSPLGAIFTSAVRRGLITTSPLALLGRRTSDRRRSPEPPHLERGGTCRPFAAADELGRRPEANYNYAPLIRLLALTGLCVGEALALRWENIDLVTGELHVRATLGRNGELIPPKTQAGARTVPLSDCLMDVLAQIKPTDLLGVEFVSRRCEGVVRSPTGISAGEASGRRSIVPACRALESRSTTSAAPLRAS